MFRKVLTVGLLFAFLFASAIPSPAAALPLFGPWQLGENGLWWEGTWSHNLTGADTPYPSLSFTVQTVKTYEDPCGGMMFTMGAPFNQTGPVTISYEMTFSVDGSADFYLAYYNSESNSWIDLYTDEDLEAGSHQYSGSVTVNIVQERKWFVIGVFIETAEEQVCESLTMEGTLNLYVGAKPNKTYQPVIKYYLWLLSRNDGTYCLLKSPTHPSVQAQNRYCFPEETNHSWVADNVVCSGAVDENNFWSCAAEYTEWLAERK